MPYDLRMDAPLPRGFPDGFGDDAQGEKDALLLLSALKGITPRALHQLAWRTGTARDCVAAIKAGDAGSARDKSAASSLSASELHRELDACGGRMVGPLDAEYPDSLFDLESDPPVCLFVRGSSLADVAVRVAVVGARNCSPVGNEVAMTIGAGLATAGVSVVSGAARGIDAASHRGALSAGGPTIAVLASGLDQPYPRASRELLDRIAAAGSVVTEYAPGTEAEPFRFPARNRIVAAVSQALVVVEGAGRSGSMITVDHALSLGRDVFAVPGAVTSPLSEVPLSLIRDGATMIRGAEDLLSDLGLTSIAGIPCGAPASGDMTTDERVVFESISGPVLPDQVAVATGLDVPAVMAALVGLEMAGLIRAHGGRYERRLLA